MPRIKNIACLGGVHGDELTGIFLIKKFQRSPSLVQRSSFETIALLGNPEAISAGRRYIDRDLNRCFSKQDLANFSLSSYEDKRAKELHKILISKDNAQVDFILDIHTTTANMGLSLVLVNEHPFNLQLAAHLCAINPSVRVYCWISPGQENAFLNSLCELGFAIEVGSVPGGCLDAALFQQTEQLIFSILDYLEAVNNDLLPKVNSFYIYKHLDILDYPRDENGELRGMIHPQLQGKDFEPLNPGDPIFLTFDNQIIHYEGTSTVFPCFINEKAYIEKHIAMCLTQRQQIILPNLF